VGTEPAEWIWDLVLFVGFLSRGNRGTVQPVELNERPACGANPAVLKSKNGANPRVDDELRNLPARVSVGGWGMLREKRVGIPNLEECFEWTPRNGLG
jgi:hypothetical protein